MSTQELNIIGAAVEGVLADMITNFNGILNNEGANNAVYQIKLPKTDTEDFIMDTVYGLLDFILLCLEKLEQTAANLYQAVATASFSGETLIESVKFSDLVDEFNKLTGAPVSLPGQSANTGKLSELINQIKTS